MKPISFFMALFFFSLAASSPAFAVFEDEVDASPDEIFLASEQVIQRDYGVYKANAGKKRVESKWNQDIVKRSRGMFKNILKQGVYRRYKLRADVKMKEKMPVLQIKGTFQERSTGTDANIPWNSVKMVSADHRLERELFFKILTQLEDNRKIASAVTSKSSNTMPVPASASPSST